MYNQRLVQQRIKELKERVSTSVKMNRFLLLVVVISITINSVLAVQLHKTSEKANQPAPVIMSTGTMEKVGDNMFEIIPDEELPPLPAHLKH